MQSQRLRIALGQINTTVGDLEGNARLVKDGIDYAEKVGADLVAFPELTVSGYPPEDLVLKPSFIDYNQAIIKDLAEYTQNSVAVIGFLERANNATFNAAAIAHNGTIAAVHHKVLLPNYGVFDERRYFATGNTCPVFTIRGIAVGVSICEDIWQPHGLASAFQRYGVDVIVNINASPYELGKQVERTAIVTDLARKNHAFVVYVNQTGGQDELVFDGASMVIAPEGSLIARLSSFEEHIVAVDITVTEPKHAAPPPIPANYARSASPEPATCTAIPAPLQITAAPRHTSTIMSAAIARATSTEAEVYQALCVGTRDYLQKTGFSAAVIALSGGIDSALVACIAVDALGAHNIVGVALPSRYSSAKSSADALTLANNLGIEFKTIPIEPAHRALEQLLADSFAGTEPGTAEENIQARIRGTIMMALSNKFNKILLTTGNKSEMATGYATLYGDMAGGFAVIKDIPKMLVYKLCHYRNSLTPPGPIPTSILTKPPSAELRPNQRDQDSLPPYETLDRILQAYIEEHKSEQEIIAAEADQPNTATSANPETVEHILKLVNLSEYKRRQSPPGIKITSLAFGRDRRMPIAMRYAF